MHNNAASQVEVRVLTQYEPEIAAGLGRLMLDLSDSVSGDPVAAERLRAIIDSPDHDQLVAELDGRIVGAAALSHIRGTLGDKAYLEDFVTSNEARGKGVGHLLWVAMENWCTHRGITVMDFTSSYARKEAHKFYKSHGATICNETAPFRVTFTKDK